MPIKFLRKLWIQIYDTITSFQWTQTLKTSERIKNKVYWTVNLISIPQYGSKCKILRNSRISLETKIIELLSNINFLAVNEKHCETCGYHKTWGVMNSYVLSMQLDDSECKLGRNRRNWFVTTRTELLSDIHYKYESEYKELWNKV